MRLLAKRDFRNPGGRLQVPDARHPNHVHAGAVFQIGNAEAFEDLPPEERNLVDLLNRADCVSEPTDENRAKVAAAIAEERAREEKAPKGRKLFNPGATERFK